jgi:hypothetical protein
MLPDVLCRKIDANDYCQQYGKNIRFGFLPVLVLNKIIFTHYINTTNAHVLDS